MKFILLRHGPFDNRSIPDRGADPIIMGWTRAGRVYNLVYEPDAARREAWFSEHLYMGRLVEDEK